MPDLLGAEVSDIASGVIIGLCVLVMLMPIAGVAFVVRDVLRQRRMVRRNAGADADLHGEQHDA